MVLCRYVLKVLMREWSEEGAAERSQSFGRIVEELSLRFRAWPKDIPPPKVLIPGAGLGRLCLDIASLVRVFNPYTLNSPALTQTATLKLKP